uniref:Glycosyltransferase 2-like domain-containing protein n=1 Tax=viral metagenome TaxID=1070528 RepID=A0A6C0JDQ7_9ZZZZ
MFDSNNHLLLTYGRDKNQYLKDIDSVLPERIKKRWIHLTTMYDVEVLNRLLNHNYMNIVLENPVTMRPCFSLFTTCYKSYDKIFRAYNSIKTQCFLDWEWVILDDSPEDEHFLFLKLHLLSDKRIRLYKRSENSGSIGNVKNEAVMLCRGKYVLEMDHDDEILPDTLLDAVNVFENDPDVGFVYMNFANLYENGDNFSYGDMFGLGYSGYYCQKHNGKWINVAVSPNINNISLSHIVAIPNHPRIWRKSSLIDIGNYSEFLPVSDDYELLLRTAVKTKIVKIPKLGYIQYMNHGNNNFSLIRNSEINRLCTQHLHPRCFSDLKINEYMNQNNALENLSNFTPIWKRENYEYKYCNKIINSDYKKQYCVIGLDVFRKNIEHIKNLYKDPENDFLLLDNKNNIDVLTCELDKLMLDKIKCYKLADCSFEELKRFFLLIYKGCDDYEIIGTS